jgi:hypothetical protein
VTGTHVLYNFFLYFLGAFNIESTDETARHINQGFLRPGQEPINGALGEERGEHTGTSSELGSNRREGKDNVETILDSVEEEVN